MTQADRLLELLRDGRPHSTVEILRAVYNLPENKGIARIGARIHDLRRKGHHIEGRPGKINKSVWWYRLTPKEEAQTITHLKRVPVKLNNQIYRVLESEVPHFIAAGGFVLPD